MFLETEPKRTKKMPLGIYLIFLLLLLLLIVVLQHILSTVHAYQQQEKNYEECMEVIVEQTPEERIIHMDVLKEKSPSSVSWIYIPGTRVDYPMVQGKDNYEFLKKDAYGNPSDAGAIFLNSFNRADMSDPKSVIFGHNMKNGSMFHDLRSYTQEKFAAEHSLLYLYMQNGVTLSYQFIGTFEADAEDEEVYTCDNSRSVSDAIAPLLNKMVKIYGQPNDRPFLILSTCIKDNRRCICLFQQMNEE